MIWIIVKQGSLILLTHCMLSIVYYLWNKIFKIGLCICFVCALKNSNSFKPGPFHHIVSNSMLGCWHNASLPCSFKNVILCPNYNTIIISIMNSSKSLEFIFIEKTWRFSIFLIWFVFVHTNLFRALRLKQPCFDSLEVHWKFT